MMKSTRIWGEYYNAVSNQKPRELLTIALGLFEKDKTYTNNYHAIDLGCGSGPNTVELLKRGWRVLAIDNQKTALEYIKQA